MTDSGQTGISQSGNGQLINTGPVSVGTGNVAISAAQQVSLREVLDQLRSHLHTADDIPASTRSQATHELERLDEELAGEQPQTARLTGGVKRLTETLAVFSGFATTLQHLRDAVSHML